MKKVTFSCIVLMLSLSGTAVFSQNWEIANVNDIENILPEKERVQEKPADKKTAVIFLLTAGERLNMDNNIKNIGAFA